MENSLKGLILASGVVITCIIVSLGFFIAREAKNAANNGLSQISEIAMSDDVMMKLYDGLRVSGKEVLEVVDKYGTELIDGSLVIQVITGRTEGERHKIMFDTELADTAAARDYSNADYINPNGTFDGSVTTDAKGRVTMKFAQR